MIEKIGGMVHPIGVMTEKIKGISAQVVGWLIHLGKGRESQGVAYPVWEEPETALSYVDILSRNNSI